MGKYTINGLKYPTFDKLTARTSTLCRSMACTLTIRKECTLEEEKIWLKHFGDMKCAYCGGEASHLDHLYPLIIERRPTGYGTEVANLVPCCKNCNQPKGNLNYEDFMKSPKCKHLIADGCTTIQQSIESRIQNIKDFEKELPAKKIDFSQKVLEMWDDILNKMDSMLKESEEDLLKIKEETLI